MKLQQLSLEDAVALNHCGATLKYKLEKSIHMYDCPPEIWSPDEYSPLLEENLSGYTFFVEIEGGQ